MNLQMGPARLMSVARFAKGCRVPVGIIDAALAGTAVMPPTLALPLPSTANTARRS